MPLFSVVIPTFNRAHRLKDALQSVMAQNHDDYEIVVSDNCSSDNTRDIVESFSNQRLRYVRPDSYLRMHDHWEFARKHAQGDYLLFLADDDCLVENALSALATVIREQSPPMVGCRSIDYYSKDYWVKAKRNHIRIEQFSGELLTIDAKVALAECFRFHAHPHYYPRVTVPIARSLVEFIANQAGRFFDYPYPEYVGFAMVYATIDRYPFLDKPLVVLGRTSDSLGPRYFWSNQDPSWREMVGKPFSFVPLKGTYMTNGAAESFLRAKNKIPGRFEGIELSLVDYYKNYYRDMLTQRWLGRDIRNDLDEFYGVLECLDPALRDRVRYSIKDFDLAKPLWYKFLRKIRALRSTLKNAAFREHNSGDQNVLGEYWINGEKVGVSDITSCAKWANSQASRYSIKEIA